MWYNAQDSYDIFKKKKYRGLLCIAKIKMGSDLKLMKLIRKLEIKICKKET